MPIVVGSTARGFLRGRFSVTIKTYVMNPRALRVRSRAPIITGPDFPVFFYVTVLVLQTGSGSVVRCFPVVKIVLCGNTCMCSTCVLSKSLER